MSTSLTGKKRGSIKYWGPGTHQEAIDEIDRLRAALEQIANGDAHYDGAAKFMEIARTALEETK